MSTRYPNSIEEKPTTQIAKKKKTLTDLALQESVA
jgi:hypothetical protein